MLNSEFNVEVGNSELGESKSAIQSGQFRIAYFNLVFALPNFKLPFSIQHSAFEIG
jgi:hypothetical protein